MQASYTPTCSGPKVSLIIRMMIHATSLCELGSREPHRSLRVSRPLGTDARGHGVSLLLVSSPTGAGRSPWTCSLASEHLWAPPCDLPAGSWWTSTFFAEAPHTTSATLPSWIGCWGSSTPSGRTWSSWPRRAAPFRSGWRFVRGVQDRAQTLGAETFIQKALGQCPRSGLPADHGLLRRLGRGVWVLEQP